MVGPGAGVRFPLRDACSIPLSSRSCRIGSRPPNGLQSCVTGAADCRFALGGTTEQRSMGTWSDGVPVTPLQVTDSP